jgi:hypothetical protein
VTGGRENIREQGARHSRPIPSCFERGGRPPPEKPFDTRELLAAIGSEQLASSGHK